jgi:hypothetical protein
MKRLSLATALLVIAVVGPAEALTQDATYRGTTDQGFKTFVKVRDGRVQSVNVPWKATRCQPSDRYAITFSRMVYTDTDSNPISFNGTKFSDSGVETRKVPGGKAKATVKVKGRFIEGNRVEGTQRISVVSKDKYGRHECKAFVRWTAKVVR